MSPILMEETPPNAVDHQYPSSSPALRRSTRHERANDGSMPTDEDSMTKAMRLRASRNLGYSQGTPPSKSFLPLSNSQVVSNLESLGISLGRCSQENLASVSVLKNVEASRSSVLLFVSPSDDLTTSDVDEEEVDDRYDGQLLTHLVGDVSEVGLDDTRLEPYMDFTVSGRKSKSSKKNNKLPKRARMTPPIKVSQ